MTPPAINSDAQAVALTVAARHLFGQTAASQAGEAPAVAQYRVIGLMTASPGAPGFAILGKNGTPPVVALEGDTIAPGVKLVQVLPRQAQLLVNGRSETVDVPESANASVIPVAPIDSKPTRGQIDDRAVLPSDNRIHSRLPRQ